MAIVAPIEITVVPCDSCNGVGTLPGPHTGKLMKRMRKTRGVNIDALVAHFPYSKTYISDLENDRRAWNNTLLALYKQAIEDAVRVRLEKEDAN